MINGPVASAGSILYFSKVSGIKVPKSAAKIITANKEMLTVMLIFILYPSANIEASIIMDQIKPFNNPTLNSFISF